MNKGKGDGGRRRHVGPMRKRLEDEGVSWAFQSIRKYKQYLYTCMQVGPMASNTYITTYLKYLQNIMASLLLCEKLWCG